jgi:hypothetical protein
MVAPGIEAGTPFAFRTDQDGKAFICITIRCIFEVDSATASVFSLRGRRHGHPQLSNPPTISDDTTIEASWMGISE